MATSDLDAIHRTSTPEQAAARARLERLIVESGVKPMTVEQLKAMGDLWPEDESVDDFIAAVREWRRDGSSRRLP